MPKTKLVCREELEKNVMNLKPNDKDGLMRVLSLAFQDLAMFCTGGMRAYNQDAAYVNNLIAENLVNQETKNSLLRFIRKKDLKGYESFVLRKARDMEQIYAKYFHSFTVRKDDGNIYNRILDMYWNKEHGLWENDTPDGWHVCTAFMPLQS